MDPNAALVAGREYCARKGERKTDIVNMTLLSCSWDFLRFYAIFLLPYQILRRSLSGQGKVFGKAYPQPSQTYKIELFARNLQAYYFEKYISYKCMLVNTCNES